MNKNIKVFLIVIAIIIIAVVGALVFWGSGGQNKDMDNNPNIANNADVVNVVTLPDGLQITDEIVGTGVEAKAGNAVAVNYIGTLENGTKFDSSYDRNQPFAFVLGAGQVIKGWDEGVAGMKVGGKRKLFIPPSLGYGAQSMGNGIIPANSTLIFEVELLGVQGR